MLQEIMKEVIMLGLSPLLCSGDCVAKIRSKSLDGRAKKSLIASTPPICFTSIQVAHLHAEIILLIVRWHLRHSLSCKDLVEMMVKQFTIALATSC